MLSLYLFAALVGGGLLAFSAFGGDDGHAGEGVHLGSMDNPFGWLSLRTLTYFLFVFGGVGAILTWSWHAATAPIIFALALTSGAGVGALTSAVFRYLHRTDSGARETDDSFVGLTGRVTLPIASGGMGKVTIQRGDRTFELLARPFDAQAGAGAPHWKAVVVVEMHRGTALVSPLDDAALPESTTS